MAAFVIGIGGGSASGKSTIAEELSKRLAPLSVEVMNQDGYFWEGPRLPRHRNRDGSRDWPDHNHPESFDLDRLHRDLGAAREGSAQVVVLEGILVLWDERVRGLMDLKLFVEADADERIVRRIRRNVARGHDLDGICDFYLDSVRYRHREFCQPSRTYADIVVPGGQDEGEERERALAAAVIRVKAAVGAAG
jgi:uridine kinase